MAWRIHHSVVRGEIDNQKKGVVHGRVWLHGLAEPLVLKLKGNAHPDLAGCRLEFTNPLKTAPLHRADSMNLLQKGTIGDLTASRKVRVFDLPFEEAYAMIKRGEKPPEHVANSLYLEWFSEANGRVVIESADYHLQICPPAWRLTPEEESQRAQDAANGFDSFMKNLSKAVESSRHEVPENMEEWDEFDFEKSMRESDAITDKYIELLEKYGHGPEAEERIAREMGWDRPDTDESKECTGDLPDVDEVNRDYAEAEANPVEPDPATEGTDWIRTKDGHIMHPLSHRAMEGVLGLMRRLRELGLQESEEPDLVTFVSEYQITGAKLAGALDSLAYGRGLHEGAFVVACLKRGLDHLHHAQGSLENLAPKRVLREEAIVHLRHELFALREEILRLMEEFRSRCK